MGVVVGGAGGELVQIILAHDNGPSPLEFGSGCGIVFRDEIGQHLRPCCGPHALGVVQVLQRQRYAVQGAATAPLGKLGGKPPSIATGLVGHHSDESVELGLQPFNALQSGIHQFQR